MVIAIACEMLRGRLVGIATMRLYTLQEHHLLFFYGATNLIESWPSQQYPSNRKNIHCFNPPCSSRFTFTT